MINHQPPLKVTNEEKAVISELRQQVAGKQGKFIKVSGGRSNNNKHERTMIKRNHQQILINPKVMNRLEHKNKAI